MIDLEQRLKDMQERFDRHERALAYVGIASQGHQEILDELLPMLDEIQRRLMDVASQLKEFSTA